MHVNSDRQLDRVVALLSRMTTARVGVSAAFTDLRDTPQALHVARVMLRGPTDSTSSSRCVRRLHPGHRCSQRAGGDDETVGAALDGLLATFPMRIGDAFETFRAWQDNDASACAAAARYSFATRTPSATGCAGIEKHTGRSLSRPRDVAELCLAFEVHRRLM